MTVLTNPELLLRREYGFLEKSSSVRAIHASTMSSASANPRLVLLDLLVLGAMALLWYWLLVLHNDSVPLQAWDEARAANNALEMDRNGHWLVTHYAGLPDHWSVKPPLLIWQMAGLMRLGFTPLLAVRLPTMLAALALAVTVWAFCRFALRDRIAAVIAGFVLLTSRYFTQMHLARTGDYDIPLTFLMCLYVLCFWLAVAENGKLRARWLALSAITVVLAVLTKGVAGTFGLLGIAIYAWRNGSLTRILRSPRTAVLAAAAIGLIGAYYVSRDFADPGYLQAVSYNEIGGRFLSAAENNARHPWYYLAILVKGCAPAILLLPLLVVTFRRTEPRRRSAASLCLWCAASILLLLSTAKTKNEWYAAPVLPYIAIAASLGASDLLRRVYARPNPLRPAWLQHAPVAALFGLLAFAALESIHRNQIKLPQLFTQSAYSEVWYGALLDDLRRGGNSRVTILDGGINGNYNPFIEFYGELAREQGLMVQIPAFDSVPGDVIIHEGAQEGVRHPNSYAGVDSNAPKPELTRRLVPKHELVATCDPNWIPRVKQLEGYSAKGEVRSCIYGVVE